MSRFRWLLSLTLASFAPIAAFAETPSVIVLEENFPPFSYVDEQGPNGYCHALMLELSTRLKWQTPIEFSPWGRAERELINNSQMLLASMMRTAPRESRFLWVTKLYEQPVFIYRLKKPSTVTINSLSELQPFIIGTQLGSASAQLLQASGIPEKNIDPVSSFQQNLHKARMGRIDFFTMPPAVLRHMIGSKRLVEHEFEHVITLIEPRSFYLVANRDFSPKLAEQIRSTMYSMERDGSLIKLKQDYGLD